MRSRTSSSGQDAGFGSFVRGSERGCVRCEPGVTQRTHCQTQQPLSANQLAPPPRRQSVLAARRKSEQRQQEKTSHTGSRCERLQRPLPVRELLLLLLLLGRRLLTLPEPAAARPSAATPPRGATTWKHKSLPSCFLLHSPAPRAPPAAGGEI